MKKISRTNSNECRFLGGSSLHRKFRSSRTVRRGTDSFYGSRSRGYTLI